MRPRLHLVGSAALVAAAAVLAGCDSPGSQGMELGAITPIHSPAGDGSGEPFLSVDDDGRVLMSWIELAPDSVHELRFATLEGERWSEARTIARGSDWFVNWADFPSIVPLGGGRLAAHFLQRHPEAARGYHYDVRIVQSADGGHSWGPAVVPHRDGVPAEHGFVSMFAAGDALGAVWLDGRKSDPAFGATGEMTLRYTTLSADGTPGEEHVLDERICDCCQTSLALTARGPIVAYRDRSEDEIRDIYVSRMIDGRWTEGVAVHHDGWQIAACPVNGPAVAAEGDLAAIAWFTAAGDTPRVRFAFSEDAGSTWGPPVEIDGGEPAGRVDVALLEGGDALVSWLERTGESAAEVRVRRVTRGGVAQPPVTVALTSGARASGFPRMVRSGDRIVFAWTESGEESAVRVAQAPLW